jgi:hypothetical protein
LIVICEVTVIGIDARHTGHRGIGKGSLCVENRRSEERGGFFSIRRPTPNGWRLDVPPQAVGAADECTVRDRLGSDPFCVRSRTGW